MKGVWLTIIFFAKLRLALMQPLFNEKYITLNIFWVTKVGISRLILSWKSNSYNSSWYYTLLKVGLPYKWKSWNRYCVKKCIMTRLLMGKFVCACSKLYFSIWFFCCHDIIYSIKRLFNIRSHGVPSNSRGISIEIWEVIEWYFQTTKIFKTIISKHSI